MIRDKFVEIFMRRFAESATPDKEYQLDFYQIIESPPSATVRIRSYTGATNVGRQNTAELNVAVDNTITAILVMDDDGKVHARPSEQEKVFVPEVPVYNKITLKLDKKYLETISRECKRNCDSGSNVREVTRKYNFFELLDDDDEREDSLIDTNVTHYQAINTVKVKYKSNINLVKLKISDYIRFNREHVVQEGIWLHYSKSCPVYLLYRDNSDVYLEDDEIEYIIVNFSISLKAGGRLDQTYEIVYKPDPSNPTGNWIAVDEYKV